MSILNAANCGNTTNTGVNACNLIPGRIVRAIAIPRGFVIPASQTTDAATFAAALKAYTQADTRASRFFLSPLLSEIDPQGGDTVNETRDNYELQVQQKPYNWGWKMTTSELNICDYKNWYNLVNNQAGAFEFILIDDAGQVWGRTATDADDAEGSGGYTMIDIVVEGWKPKTGSALPEYMFRLKFLNNLQLITQFSMVAANVFPDNSWGLIGVTLTAASTASTTTHVRFSGKMGCGASTLGGVYGDTLADADAFVITDNGTPITPASVAYNSTGDYYDATVSTLTVGHTIRVLIAPPSEITVAPFGANIISETAYSYVVA